MGRYYPKCHIFAESEYNDLVDALLENDAFKHVNILTHRAFYAGVALHLYNIKEDHYTIPTFLKSFLPRSILNCFPVERKYFSTKFYFCIRKEPLGQVNFFWFHHEPLMAFPDEIESGNVYFEEVFERVSPLTQENLLYFLHIFRKPTKTDYSYVSSL